MSSIFDNLWIEKFRPTSFDDVVLQPELREFCEQCKKTREIPHLLFCSAPGSGKTTLARCFPKELDLSYRYLNASDERGIDAIRSKVVEYAQTKSLNGKLKIIILDEMDGLTGEAQRALRNVMEEYSNNVRFILTANYKNRVTKPIRSRVQAFELIPPLKDCTRRIVDIIKSENIRVSDDQKPKLNSLIKTYYPDLRLIINTIQQNTLNNELKISQNVTYTQFAGKVMKMILVNKHANEIRKYVIENELSFGADYQNLLKGLFEYVFISVDDEDKKRKAMLIVGRFMESHQQVMDFEINCFCCILNLLEVLS